MLSQTHLEILDRSRHQGSLSPDCRFSLPTLAWISRLECTCRRGGPDGCPTPATVHSGRSVRRLGAGAWLVGWL